MLLAAKAGEKPDMASVRRASREVPLTAAGLRVCRYDDGGNGTASLPGLAAVPAVGCTQPTAAGPGRDFMTGGLMGQATQDISAKFLGGYTYGNACGLGGGQDERLMVYFPEVSALTFFLSEAGPDGTYGPPQLRQPAWILGARRLLVGIDGTGRFGAVAGLDTDVPLTSDLRSVALNGTIFSISSLRPFVAFMSENQGFLGWPEAQVAIQAARVNREPRQRDVDPDSPWSFEKQVRAWYHSVALTSYPEEVRAVLRGVVSSVGAGPWLAGLWWGDSQIGFLASWLGHAAAAASWAGAGGGRGVAPPLDYYLYSAFTENPGNQCFVHSTANCRACMARCSATTRAAPTGTVWLPGTAFMGPDGDTNPCPTIGTCGERGLEDVVAMYASRSVSDLWKDVEATLEAHIGDVRKSVFDIVLELEGR